MTSSYLTEASCEARLKRYTDRLAREFYNRIRAPRLDPSVKSDLHALPRSVRLAVIAGTTQLWHKDHGY